MPGKGAPLWELSAADKRRTALWRFAEITGHDPRDYPALHAWSVAHPVDYHAALWDFLDVIGEKGDSAYMAGPDIRSASFYPGARLNYAENLLREADGRPAIIAHRDDGSRRTLTRRQLRDRVSQLAQAFQALGVGTGDRVAAIVTNDVEAIVGYLACAAIGAVWSSCSPDFGPAGATDRLCQVDPKILLAVPGYRYGEKHVDVCASIRAVAETGGVEKVILVADRVSDDLAGLPCITWDTLLGAYSPAPITYVRLPFDAPLAILFSSGTTGKPKCIVHSAMGLLLQHLKELVLHCNLTAGERFFYFTTCGWMMWNWQVSGLAVGATLVTYDGNPFHPEPGRLVRLIDDERINIFGTSAKYLGACRQAGLTPATTHGLESLRMILSTGSPLLPDQFDYLYTQWKADIHVASISGGTDICGCFLGGNPLLPVRRGELQCAFLGMDVAVFDESGTPVTGRPGELVCRNPHLSMPLGFRGDADGSAYHGAYFDRFANTWTHGDFVEQCADGGFIIYGRSDTTLNPGGVRIGTAEIYRLVETVAGVTDCIAVAQDWRGDQRIILFVVLAPGATLDTALETTIRQRIRQDATPRHVPALILAVPAIPRTRSGKISEMAVRETIHGRPLNNREALANPECLDYFTGLRELEE